MPERAAETSTAVTEGIRVTVRSQYLPDQSVPGAKRYVFAYTVRIENEGSEPAQLRTRHWIITDGGGKVEEVRGPGRRRADAVPAARRALRVHERVRPADPPRRDARDLPDDRPDGREFDAAIAPFVLALPHSLN